MFNEKHIKKLNKYLKNNYDQYKANIVNYDDIEIINIYNGQRQLQITYNYDIEKVFLKHINTDGYGVTYEFINDIVSCLEEEVM